MNIKKFSIQKYVIVVFLTDLQVGKGYSRFTPGPFKPLIKYLLFLVVFLALKLFNSYKFSIVFEARNVYVNFVEKSELKFISFQKQKHGFLIHTWSDRAVKGRVVHQTCDSINEGPLKIMFTDNSPLIQEVILHNSLLK